MALTSTKFTQFCLQYASIALLYYDYFLTFGQEVRYIWRKRFNISTLMYICCRYALVANVLYLLAITNNVHSLSCTAAYQICSALGVLARVAVVVVWGMRTYAIYSRHPLIIVIFGPLGLLVILLAAIHVRRVSCGGAIPAQEQLVINLQSIFTLAYEVLTTIFSTIICLKSLRNGRDWWIQRDSFIALVLEDGLLYFVFISMLTMLSVVFEYANVNGQFVPRLLNALVTPLSGLMTARFLLHLRQWEEEHTNPGRHASSLPMQSLHFAQRPDTSGTEQSTILKSTTA